MPEFIDNLKQKLEGKSRSQKFKTIIGEFEKNLSRHEQNIMEGLAKNIGKITSHHPIMMLGLSALGDVLLPSVSKALSAELDALEGTVQSTHQFIEKLKDFEKQAMPNFDEIASQVGEQLEEKIDKICQSNDSAKQSTLEDFLEQFTKNAGDAKKGFAKIESRLDEIIPKLDVLKDGQAELKDGQAVLKDGQAELKDGQAELKDGQDVLKDGQAGIKAGIDILLEKSTGKENHAQPPDSTPISLGIAHEFFGRHDEKEQIINHLKNFFSGNSKGKKIL